ncbi:lipopolysaccharide biosynthesis protein [Caulobacter sp. DWP3-1-3b2]|uniref:lipopolysaccharide biosynthesis protein n=1 Tax=Caulobacter sp. DWP3-1-3b2 TaxID=2804643 RepID=UPI003CF89143
MRFRLGNKADVIITAGGQLLQQALTIVTGVLIARMLGAAAYGVVNILRNIYTALIILAPAGLDLALLKFVGREEDGSRNVEVLIGRLRLIVLAVNVILLGGGWLLLSGPLMTHVYRFAHFDVLLLITLAGVPIAADLAIMGAYYRGRHRPGVFAMMTLYVQPVARLTLVLLSLALLPNTTAVVLINLLQVAISGLIVTLHHSLVLSRGARAEGSAVSAESSAQNWREAAGLLSESIWMAMNLFVYGMLRFVDILMLGVFASAKAVGEYAAISTVAQLVQVWPLAASQTLGPTIARRYHEGDMAGVRSALSGYIHMAAIVAGFVFGGVAAFGDRLDLVFGHSFQFDATIAFLMPLGYLLSATLAPMGYALSMTGKHRTELAILILGGVVLVGLCAVLTPRYGAVGASISVALTFALINVVRFVVVARLLGFVPGKLRDLLPPLIAVACAFPCKGLLESLLGRDLIATIAACMLYSLVYALIALRFLINKSDRAALLGRLAGFVRRKGVA